MYSEFLIFLQKVVFKSIIVHFLFIIIVHWRFLINLFFTFRIFNLFVLLKAFYRLFKSLSIFFINFVLQNFQIIYCAKCFTKRILHFLNYLSTLYQVYSLYFNYLELNSLFALWMLSDTGLDIHCIQIQWILRKLKWFHNDVSPHILS